jgi:hypothetical protein
VDQSLHMMKKYPPQVKVARDNGMCSNTVVRRQQKLYDLSAQLFAWSSAKATNPSDYVYASYPFSKNELRTIHCVHHAGTGLVIGCCVTLGTKVDPYFLMRYLPCHGDLHLQMDYNRRMKKFNVYTALYHGAYDDIVHVVYILLALTNFHLSSGNPL